MKKLLPLMLICSLMFSACGDSNSSSESQSSTETTLADTTTADSTPADTSSSAEISNTSDSDLPADDGTSADSVQNSPLADAVAAVTNAVEWPVLEQITDPDIALEFFKLDLANSNYEDIVIMQCPMSATMAEIIVIKAADVDAAKADLEERQAKMRDTDAFYPNDVEIAEKSIVGTSGNYVYFLAGINAADSEEILIENLQ